MAIEILEIHHTGIRIDTGAGHMSELHRKLNTAELQFKEEWPYIPHVTIVKMGSEPPAKAAFEIALLDRAGDFHLRRR